MKRVLIVFLLIVPALGGYSPSLKSDPALDQFLLRLSNRYGIMLPRSYYSQPMHAAEVLQFLDVVDSLDRAGKLTQQESCQYKNVRAIVGEDRRLFQLSRPEKEIVNYGNCVLSGYVAPSYEDDAEIGLRGVINPRLSGASGNLSYFTEVSVWTEYRSDTVFGMSDYQPYHGNPYNLGGGRVKTSSTRSADLIRGGVVYQGKRIDLETAVDNLRSGPAVVYPLTFSGQTSPVTYFRARMDLADFQYVHTFGLLRTQKDKPKYIYTHRLDIPLAKNKILIGINEVIINGSTAEKAQTDSLPEDYYGEERGWEWVYMIPFIPYSFAEHYVGDRDNKVLSFDIMCAVPRGFRWYLEFFFDDFASPLKLFSDDFGNKWAFTLGGQYFGALGNRDVTFSGEYSRIEPWVYTHFYGGSHRYTHYGQSLGSNLGPNSDAVTIQGEYAVGVRNTVGLFLENVRKGTGRGSSVLDVFQGEEGSNPDSGKKTFLGKNYVRTTTFGLLWKLMPFELFSMHSEVTINQRKEIGVTITGGFTF
jgi:hypothetical protein